MRRPWRRLFRRFTIVVVGLAAGCGRAAVADDVSIEWSMRPEVAVVGRPVVGTVRVLDTAGHAVAVTALEVEAHMSHPGMAPVLASGRPQSDGSHDVHLTFTMSGDWILRVSGSLADGRRLDSRVDVRDVRPSG